MLNTYWPFVLRPGPDLLIHPSMIDKAEVFAQQYVYCWKESEHYWLLMQKVQSAMIFFNIKGLFMKRIYLPITLLSELVVAKVDYIAAY